MNKNTQLKIEKMANNVRNECQVSGYGIQNIFDDVEKIGYEVIRYPIGENSFLGFSLIKEVGKIIFTNSSLILSREIFSVAHELGHHTLHLKKEGLTLIKDDDFCDRDENEVEANYFAACFLMPRDKVDLFIRYEIHDKPVTEWNGLDIAKIQSTFNVSYDMVLFRLKSLGILNYNIFEKLQIDKFENSATRLLTAIKGNIDLCKASYVKQIPAEYLEWVITNYNEKLITINDLDSLLNYVDLNVDDVDINSNITEDDESIDDLLGGIE